MAASAPAGVVEREQTSAPVLGTGFDHFSDHLGNKETLDFEIRLGSFYGMLIYPPIHPSNLHPAHPSFQTIYLMPLVTAKHVLETMGNRKQKQKQKTIRRG